MKNYITFLLLLFVVSILSACKKDEGATGAGFSFIPLRTFTYTKSTSDFNVWINKIKTPYGLYTPDDFLENMEFDNAAAMKFVNLNTVILLSSTADSDTLEYKLKQDTLFFGFYIDFFDTTWYLPIGRYKNNEIIFEPYQMYLHLGNDGITISKTGFGKLTPEVALEEVGYNGLFDMQEKDTLAIENYSFYFN